MGEIGLFDAMYSTRAMRRLRRDPIPEQTLRKIIDAGVHAPSGGNLQEWGFILVRDQGLKRFIRDRYWDTWQARLGPGRAVAPDLPPARRRMLEAAAHLAEHLDEAPVILLACSAREYPPFSRAGSPRASAATMHASIYPAVQNILLACRALGVAATLTTVHCFFEE